MSDLSETQQNILQKLLRHWPSSDYGTWEIKGEDPNCDFAGPHIQPSMGLFEGTYGDVCEHAVRSSGFIGWGAGGSIKKVTITKLDEAYKAKQARIQGLKEQRASIDAELERLTK